MKDEIIDLVFNTPSVWDKSHKHHHNRHVLAKEWKKIAAKLGAAEIEVRRCWKNLRQEFGKQLRKSEYQSGEAASDDIQWPFFQKLLFLQDQFTTPSRKTTDSIFTDTPDELSTLSARNTDDSDSELNSDDDIAVLPSDFLIQNVATPPSDMDHVPRASTSMNHPPTLSPSHLPASRSSRIQISKSSFRKRKMIEFEKEKVPQPQNERPPAIDYHIDEDVGFFNSILPHVKTLAPRDKFIFRMKVQQTLFDLAFAPHESSQHRTSFSSSRQSNGVSGNEIYPGSSHIYEYYKSETEMSD